MSDRKPVAWDCVAYDGGRYLIRAVEGAEPRGWPSCEPLYGESDVIPPGHTVIPPGHIQMPANIDEAKAMTLLGESWLKANAPEQLNPQTGIMMSPTEMILTQDENSLVGVVMRLTGGSANPNVVRGQIERIRKEKACETTSSPS